MDIAVLTAAENMSHACSRSHVVSDQLTCLIEHAHRPTLFTTSAFPGLDDRITVTPFHSCSVQRAYPVDPTPDRLAEILVSILADYKVAFTHDWIFLDRFQPYAEALKLAADRTRHIRFFHWVHSIPTIKRPWWDLNRYGDNHTLVYENHTDAERVGRLFDVSPDRVRVVYPVIDVRLLLDHSGPFWIICREIPELFTADYVQIYPAGSDRFDYKGIKQLILVFKALKRLGKSICLVIVDSWSGRDERADLCEYRQIIEANGLTEREVLFTSEIEGFENGMPRPTLTALMHFSNVFAYPTFGEAFGLIGPETMLCSAALPIVNSSLPMMEEVFGGHAHCATFGSTFTGHKSHSKSFFESLARLTVDSTESNPFWQPHDHARKTFNLDAVYRSGYEPILKEAADVSS